MLFGLVIPLTSVSDGPLGPEQGTALYQYGVISASF